MPHYDWGTHILLAPTVTVNSKTEQVWNLTEQRWEMGSTGRVTACLTGGRTVTGLHCTCWRAVGHSWIHILMDIRTFCVACSWDIHQIFPNSMSFPTSIFFLRPFKWKRFFPSLFFLARPHEREKWLLVSLCLSVCPHGKTRLILEGFSWNL